MSHIEPQGNLKHRASARELQKAAAASCYFVATFLRLYLLAAIQLQVQACVQDITTIGPAGVSYTLITQEWES